MEIPIDENVVKRAEEILKKGKQPTFDQYNMFEWTPRIPIMDDITESEEEDLNG